MIYLDNAATTMIKPVSVGRSMLRVMNTCASPGRGGHRPAMEAARIVYACREQAAALFHMEDPAQVVFTMNATHALNIAIRSLAKPGMKVLISGFEHNSVTRPLTQIGADFRAVQAPLFEPEQMLAAFREAMEGTELVVCTHVSNVFGYILPVSQIAALCREKGIPMIVDASQSAGILDVDFGAWDAAFVAMPGHKALFGPQGTGLLLCGMEGQPLLSGGSGSDSIEQTMPDYLPDRLEAGTHNVTGIAGLLAGMEYVTEKGIDTIARHEGRLLSCIIHELRQIPELEVFAGPEGSQSGVVSFRPIARDCEELAQYLSERDICLRSGLHCAPFAHRSAGTLETGTLRASFSPFTTLAEVEKCCDTVRDFFRTVR